MTLLIHYALCTITYQAVLVCRGPGVRRGRSLHPGSVRGQEQVDHEGDLLSHDLRHRHPERPVRIRRGDRRDHCQQSERLWPVLSLQVCSAVTSNWKIKHSILVVVVTGKFDKFFFVINFEAPSSSQISEEETQNTKHINKLTLNVLVMCSPSTPAH